VLLPLLLILLASLATAVVGYGADPRLGRFIGGIEAIALIRQYQWLLIALTLLPAVGLVALIAAGKRRAWWLIGLAPVLVLFVHRFVASPTSDLRILDHPQWLEASRAHLADDDWVVGVSFARKHYALAFADLAVAPVVMHSDFDQRMVVLWSAYANRALALQARPSLKARDLSIVSMPANALLVYNSRRGEFISGINGLTLRGQAASGLGQSLETWKTTWRHWRTAHPQTLVMAACPDRIAAMAAPLEMRYPLPAKAGAGASRRVALIASTQPIAVAADAIASGPLNLSAGPSSVLLLRDSSTRRLWAFARMLGEDQPAQFALNTDSRRKGTYVDSVSKSGWAMEFSGGTVILRAVDGPAAKSRLKLTQVPVDGDLPWGVVKMWYPSTVLVTQPATAPIIQSDDPRPRPTSRPARRPRR
jgi:hypothetical protein